MYPSLLHKMAPFCMNTAKKSSAGGPPDPHPFKHMQLFLDPIIHRNTEKSNIKTFQQLNTIGN